MMLHRFILNILESSEQTKQKKRHDCKEIVWNTKLISKKNPNLFSIIFLSFLLNSKLNLQFSYRFSFMLKICDKI